MLIITDRKILKFEGRRHQREGAKPSIFQHRFVDHRCNNSDILCKTRLPLMNFGYAFATSFYFFSSCFFFQKNWKIKCFFVGWNHRFSQNGIRRISWLNKKFPRNARALFGAYPIFDVKTFIPLCQTHCKIHGITSPNMYANFGNRSGKHRQSAGESIDNQCLIIKPPVNN